MLSLDSTLKNRKLEILDYFRNRSIESLEAIKKTYGNDQYKERARAVNQAITETSVAFCGKEAYEKIKEFSRFDLNTWIASNVDWQADLTKETILHLGKNNLSHYLIGNDTYNYEHETKINQMIETLYGL